MKSSVFSFKCLCVGQVHGLLQIKSLLGEVCLSVFTGDLAASVTNLPAGPDHSPNVAPAACCAVGSTFSLEGWSYLGFLKTKSTFLDFSLWLQNLLCPLVCGYLPKNCSCRVVYAILEGCAYFVVDASPGTWLPGRAGGLPAVQVFPVFLEGLSGW